MASRRARHPRVGGRLEAADIGQLGALVGIEPVFEYTERAHTLLWPDVTYVHEVLGHTKVPWRKGFRRTPGWNTSPLLTTRRQPCEASSTSFNTLLGRITAVVNSRSGE